VNEFAGGYPGYDGLISRTTASVAKVLNYIGYNTFHLGECNTDVLDSAPSAHRDVLPSHVCVPVQGSRTTRRFGTSRKRGLRTSSPAASDSRSSTVRTCDHKAKMSLIKAQYNQGAVCRCFAFSLTPCRFLGRRDEPV
jgi:hypothetical protein